MKPATWPRHARYRSSHWDYSLDRLEKIDPQLAKIVELRVFGGLTIEEAASVLTVSPSTAKRDWRAAKAWLTRDLASEV
jgi:DNA-directed RNA polymerase specialized sigma24 family protein